MAPEQAAGDPATDHRADIYAFGCMAYELLAGRPPFAGLPPHKLLVAHMGETPKPVAELRTDCPPALASLVMQCLAKDPAARPASASELLRPPRRRGVALRGERRDARAAHRRPTDALARARASTRPRSSAVAIVARAAIIAIGLPTGSSPARWSSWRSGSR